MNPINGLKLIYRAIRTIENWYELPLYYLGLKRPLIIKLRNGLRFKFGRKIFGVEVFLDEPYKKLAVNGKDVIDVGAFNGDSAMYFALKGAKRVIAFEAFPQTYDIALANLQLNSFPNIVILNEAVSGSDGRFLIDKKAEVSSGNQLAETSGTFAVVTSTLRSLVKRFDLHDACLKLDCEGLEYEILLSAYPKSIAAFSEIILEYHHGPERLQKHLSACGFSTTVLDEYNNGEGILYATRNTN